MKILVTGATGFIGRQVLKVLSGHGHDIHVLTQSPSESQTRLPVHCRVFEWASTDYEIPPEALEGVQAVVHLAGATLMTRWNPERKEVITDSRVRSTHQLVRAMKAMETPPAVLVSSSGVGVYGDRGDEELDEDSGGGQSFLAHLCHKWEMEALQARSAGIRTVLLRTGVVLGAEGGALQRMLPPFRLGLGGRLGSGDQWISWIHVHDLARMIHHALENQDLEGPVNAVSPHPVTNAEFTTALGNVLRRPTLFPIPEWALTRIFGEVAQVLLSSQRVLPRKVEASGYRFEYGELMPALQVIADIRTHELLMEQWVPQPLEKVFPFFSDANNLEILTPPYLKFKVVGKSSPEIEEGMRINYRLQLHGIPFRWQSMIMDWKPMTRFSDIQVVGPYQLWHHTHDFIPKNGGTLLRDRAIYRIPLWVIGDFLLHPFIRKDLEKIFSYRRNKIRELFGE